jgi:hypothetical protein
VTARSGPGREDGSERGYGPDSQVACHRRGHRSGRERGSVLALVPAGFLVLVILAALAVDGAVTYLGQEQLHDALSAAANDAVTAALDNGSFYRSGSITVDPAQAGHAVCVALLAQNAPALHGLEVWMAVDGASLQLRGKAEVSAVFGRVIPGFARHTVEASAAAVAAEGPMPSSAPAPKVSGLGAAGLFAPLRC